MAVYLCSNKLMTSLRHPFVRKISGLKKLAFCLAISVIVYVGLVLLKIDLNSRVILAWDAFCISMISLSWLLFFTTTPKELREVVKSQDDGVEVMFMIVLIGVCVSLFGALILLSSKGESSFNRVFHAIVSFSPVLLSWCLLHTVFAVRYAHLYHDQERVNKKAEKGGLDFPDTPDPDYVDFAYFSFVIGMTFQVSDVEISSSLIRRFVLLHSLIAFVFNTVIVALTISSIGGLMD